MCLKELSNAATGGTWYGVGVMVETDDDDWPDPASCNPAHYDQDMLDDYVRGEENAVFIAALVNAYREGRLIEASPPHHKE